MIEFNDTEQMTAAVDFYMENSKMKSNGVREVPKAAFVKRLTDVHGIEETDYKKLQHAVDFETTAAARVALADVETKIGEASKDDLANDDFRKGLSSTVRLPTFSGATEVECRAEKWSNVPFRGDGDAEAPAHKVTHGSFRTTINTKGRIDKNLHTEATDRIRAKLGVEG